MHLYLNIGPPPAEAHDDATTDSTAVSTTVGIGTTMKQSDESVAACAGVSHPDRIITPSGNKVRRGSSSSSSRNESSTCYTPPPEEEEGEAQGVECNDVVKEKLDRACDSEVTHEANPVNRDSTTHIAREHNSSATSSVCSPALKYTLLHSESKLRPVEDIDGGDEEENARRMKKPASVVPSRTDGEDVDDDEEEDEEEEEEEESSDDACSQSYWGDSPIASQAAPHTVNKDRTATDIVDRGSVRRREDSRNSGGSRCDAAPTSTSAQSNGPHGMPPRRRERNDDDKGAVSGIEAAAETQTVRHNSMTDHMHQPDVCGASTDRPRRQDDVAVNEKHSSAPPTAESASSGPNKRGEHKPCAVGVGRGAYPRHGTRSAVVSGLDIEVATAKSERDRQLSRQYLKVRWACEHVETNTASSTNHNSTHRSNYYSIYDQDNYRCRDGSHDGCVVVHSNDPRLSRSTHAVEGVDDHCNRTEAVDELACIESQVEQLHARHIDSLVQCYLSDPKYRTARAVYQARLPRSEQSLQLDKHVTHYDNHAAITVHPRHLASASQPWRRHQAGSLSNCNSKYGNYTNDNSVVAASGSRMDRGGGGEDADEEDAVYAITKTDVELLMADAARRARFYDDTLPWRPIDFQSTDVELKTTEIPRRENAPGSDGAAASMTAAPTGSDVPLFTAPCGIVGAQDNAHVSRLGMTAAPSAPSATMTVQGGCLNRLLEVLLLSEVDEPFETRMAEMNYTNVFMLQSSLFVSIDVLVVRFIRFFRSVRRWQGGNVRHNCTGSVNDSIDEATESMWGKKLQSTTSSRDVRARYLELRVLRCLLVTCRLHETDLSFHTLQHLACFVENEGVSEGPLNDIDDESAVRWPCREGVHRSSIYRCNSISKTNNNNDAHKTRSNCVGDATGRTNLASLPLYTHRKLDHDVARVLGQLSVYVSVIGHKLYTRLEHKASSRDDGYAHSNDKWSCKDDIRTKQGGVWWYTVMDSGVRRDRISTIDMRQIERAATALPNNGRSSDDSRRKRRPGAAAADTPYRHVLGNRTIDNSDCASAISGDEGVTAATAVPLPHRGSVSATEELVGRHHDAATRRVAETVSANAAVVAISDMEDLAEDSEEEEEEGAGRARSAGCNSVFALERCGRGEMMPASYWAGHNPSSDAPLVQAANNARNDNNNYYSLSPDSISSNYKSYNNNSNPSNSSPSHHMMLSAPPALSTLQEEHILHPFDIHAQQFVHQLCLLSFRLFVSIPARELWNHTWTDPDLRRSVPHYLNRIRDFTHHFALWTAAVIVAQPVWENCRRSAHHLLEVCRLLYDQQNYEMASAVMHGLTHASVTRLEQLYVSAHGQRMFDANAEAERATLCGLMDPYASYSPSSLNSVMARTAGDMEMPIIPMIAPILRELTRLEHTHGQTTIVRHGDGQIFINWDKVMAVGSFAFLWLRCQQVSYTFLMDPVLQDYLWSIKNHTWTNVMLMQLAQRTKQ